MKKAISIIALITLVFTMVCAACGPVNAAGTATFTLTCEAPKAQSVGQTKELTIYYGVKDFVNLDQYADKGVNIFRGILDYDKDVFEPLEINLDKNGNYAGIKSETKKGDAAITGQNNWTGITFNPENGKLVVTNGAYVNSDENVLKVVLRVKASAKVGKTTVTLKDVETANTEADIYPSNKSVSIDVEIIASISEPVDPKHEDGFGGYIRILPDTTVEELKALQPVFTNIKDSSGRTLSSTDYVPTGATTADSNFSYTIIAVGDLNSDGKLSALDLSQLKAHIVKSIKTLNDNQKRAADIKWDGKLYASDLSQMKMLITELGDPKVAIWSGQGEPTCIPVEG